MKRLFVILFSVFMVCVISAMVFACSHTDPVPTDGQVQRTGAGNDPSCWHEYVTGMVEEGTCTRPFLSRSTCTKCGAFEEYNMPPLGHAYVRTLSMEGTCLQPYEYEVTCLRCGDSYMETEGFGGHAWEDGTFLAGDDMGHYKVQGRKCTLCGTWYAQGEVEP